MTVAHRPLRALASWLTSSSCTRPSNDRGCKEGQRRARQYQVLVEQMR
jgi:hypothetical protein